MKPISIAALILLFAVIACNSSNTTPAVIQPNLKTVVAATFQALTANAPTPTPQPAIIEVTFQNVSFIIPEGLASGAVSELVPAADENNSDPWSIAPAYASFKLTDYSTPVGSFEALLRVYPMQEYVSVNSWAESSLARLQETLANPAGPFTNDTLPTVPFNGAAAQEYAAQAKLLSFNSGAGIRMISQYGQFPAPILKNNSFYHYEGLTSDGKYLVAVLLPVSLPLQSTSENVSADGIPFPSNPMDAAAMTAYYQGVTDLLNAARPESFQPPLTQLDELIQSITITSP
ncbi:MAG: hypothetical protein HY863_19895 [Chloroflexi bacterium]|nr:hypothetical protein [Chloroflexota bacterium]